MFTNKNFIKSTATCFILAAALGLSVPTYAQETTQDIISNLRAQHQALKEKVASGEITKESADATWQTLIEEARAQKDAQYLIRKEKVQALIDRITEKNPEQASELTALLAAADERRATYRQERLAIEEKLKSGEITSEQAREQKAQIRANQEQNRATLKTTLQEQKALREQKRLEKQTEEQN